jgi:hypothetical protein
MYVKSRQALRSYLVVIPATLRYTDCALARSEKAHWSGGGFGEPVPSTPLPEAESCILIGPRGNGFGNLSRATFISTIVIKLIF